MLLAKVIKCSPSVSSIITTRLVQLRGSNVKEILQFCGRKTILTPSGLVLGGTFLFKADLSVTELAAQSSPSESPLEERRTETGLRSVLVWLLHTGRLLVHSVRTLLVFTPLLLSCPLLLLPASIRPSALLLDLLGRAAA